MARYIIVLALFALLYYLGWYGGKTNGRMQAIVQYNEEIAEISKKLKESTDLHVEQQRKNLNEIEGLKDIFANSVHALRSEYESRLQQSEERSNSYRERVSSSSSECRTIAEHAARLDRSLTEGRELVRELREHIKQAELINKELRNYLVNDRNFLNDR